VENEEGVRLKMVFNSILGQITIKIDDMEDQIIPYQPLCDKILKMAIILG